MLNGTLALGPPTTNTTVVDGLMYWKQPGMPRNDRSRPGLICARPSTVAPSAVPAGMFEVTMLMPVPSTGRAEAARPRPGPSLAAELNVNPAGSVAEMSRLPGSFDAPPGE